MAELQKSYDQFLHRTKLLKQRRARVEAMPNTGETTTSDSAEENSGCTVGRTLDQSHPIPINDLDKSAPFRRDNTGQQADETYDHGLTDPTIYTKEAMNAISSMFKEALGPETMSTSLNMVKQKPNQHGSAIDVFVDGEMDESGDVDPSIATTRPVSLKLVKSDSSKKNGNVDLQKPFVGAFKILADDEDDENDEDDDHGDFMELEDAWPTNSHTSTETRIDIPDIRFKDDTVIRRLKEDTVIRKFVGSTVFDDPKVENACHHGLVDPTVNLRQAMEDINGMFGKTLNFVKTSKAKKQEKLFDRKPDNSKQAFFILADDNIEKDLNGRAAPCISQGSDIGGNNLFEPTLFTKEAMNEINDLFVKPLDL